MKKIVNIFNILFVLAVAVAFHACGDDAEYTPAEALSNAQVYFPSTNSATINVSKTQTSFDVTIMRIKTDEAQTVNIVGTGGEGLFTIPSTVSFAQGESNALITIGYDPEKIEYDTYSTITLKVSDETITTPYGMSEYSFQVGIPAPWTSLGECTFYDNFLFVNSYKAELQQNDLNPNLFRLVDPYSEGLEKEGFTTNGDQSEYVEFTLLKPGDKINDVTITMEDLVYFPAYCTGFYNTSNGYNTNVDAHHPSDFTDFQDESYWTFSKVVSYQENGLPAVVQLAPYYYMNGLGGWDNTVYNEVVKIVFPGVADVDYSLSVAYAGKYTSAKDEDAGVIAQLTEVGEDLESIRLAVVAGTDVNKAVEGIRNGAIESVEVGPDAETAMVPFASKPETGVYTLVAVGYAGNAAQAAASAEFNYTNAPAETWTAISTGDYVYTLFFGTEDEPYYDKGLVLYQSDEDPTRYKIEHWGNDVDFIFTYDEATGQVMVEDQEVGYVHAQYGTVFVDDLVDYTGGDKYGYSYFKDGVFHFAVVYYVNDGEFGFGEETFTLTGNAESTKVLRAPKSEKTANLSSIEKKFHIKKMDNKFPTLIK